MGAQPNTTTATQFLPKTIKKLTTAIKCNSEIAAQYERQGTKLALSWAAHHRARVAACEEKLQKIIDERDES